MTRKLITLSEAAELLRTTTEAFVDNSQRDSVFPAGVSQIVYDREAVLAWGLANGYVSKLSEDAVGPKPNRIDAVHAGIPYRGRDMATGENLVCFTAEDGVGDVYVLAMPEEVANVFAGHEGAHEGSAHTCVHGLT